MSKRKVHVWDRGLGNGRYLTWCGEELDVATRPQPTPTKYHLNGASCLHCLRIVRDSAMRQAAANAETAEKSTRRIESLRAKKARRGK